MKEAFIQAPKQFESPEDLLMRRNAVVGFMKEHLKYNPLGPNQRYGIVSHSIFIAAMTAQGLDENDCFGLKEYIFPVNCQLVPYPFRE